MFVRYKVVPHRLICNDLYGDDRFFARQLQEHHLKSFDMVGTIDQDL